MTSYSKEKHFLTLLIIGLLAWAIPGAGHLAIRKKSHAIIIFTAIVLTFLTGLFIGSIAVIDPVGAKPWYVAQIMNSPAVVVLGHIAQAGDYFAYGRPNEIGQIYTSIAGLLNLLCIVNAVYLAHLQETKT